MVNVGGASSASGYYENDPGHEQQELNFTADDSGQSLDFPDGNHEQQNEIQQEQVRENPNEIQHER